MNRHFKHWISLLLVLCLLATLPSAWSEETAIVEDGNIAAFIEDEDTLAASEVEEATVAEAFEALPAEEAVGEVTVELGEEGPSEGYSEIGEANEDDVLLLGADEAATSEDMVPQYDAQLFASAADVSIDEAHFPDAAFREYVASRLDNDKDGVLSDLEISWVTRIDVRSSNISSLEGLSIFTALEDLECFNNQLTELDVSKNTKLQELDCGSNALTRLDLSNQTELIELRVLQNFQLTQLDLSNCPKLEVLDCARCDLTQLDLKHCPKLKTLYCQKCKLSSLNLAGFSNLEELSIDYSPITMIDVSNCTALRELDCCLNELTTLKISGCSALQRVRCWDNRLKTLNLSGCTSLERLECGGNELTVLDVSSCSNLIHLDCIDNGIAKLDIRGCPKIIPYVNASYYEYHDGYGYDYHDGSHSGHVDDYVTYEVLIDEDYDLYEGLSCDASVTIIGGSPVAPKPTATSAPNATATPTPKATATSAPNATATPTPKPTATPKATPSIGIFTKTAKATALVGTQYKIDLNGATAKSFKSSKKKVATVDNNGVVTPKAQGKTKITVKIGKKTRTLTLTVKDPTIPTKVTLDKSGTITWYKQDALTLNVTLPVGTYSGISWKSSNKKVATVSDGKLTFKKAGTTTITATATRGKKKAKVKIKVIDGSKATAIKINPPSTTTLKVGEKLTLTASATIARPVDPAKPTVDPKARWTSSNKKVLTVNKTTGEITAKKPGTATITVTAGSKKKAKIKITVTK